MEVVLSPRQSRIAGRGLVKLDRPRAIDRYIDYFGGPVGDAARVADSCGEHLMDCFEADESRAIIGLRQAVAS